MSGVERELVHGLFTPAAEQIARVREWNKEFVWGFSDEAFAEAEKSIPAWPENKLVAVVLVPYLSDIHRTFHELWMRAAAEQDSSVRLKVYDSLESIGLCLLPGIEHPSTSSERVALRWEVIDFGSGHGHQPTEKDRRNAMISPHAGILAAAALHPNWVKRMNGHRVPYVFLPGYEMQIPAEHLWPWPWTAMPKLSFDNYRGKIELMCHSAQSSYSCWSAPSFFRG